MAGWKILPDVVTALGQVMLNLSLGPDMYMIHCRKNVGEMLALPLVSMLVNCHLWMCYGILRSSILPVAVSQGFGQLTAIVFILIYFHWSSTQARKDMLKMVTGQSHYDSSILIGYFGVAINVCMFASPFATLKYVVGTKSASSIPINLCLMIFASSILWVATGLMDSDCFITGLNLIGIVLGTIQMGLYYIYRPGRGVEAPLDQQNGSNGELPVVVSPTFKSSSVVVSIESPAYTPLSSPRTRKAV